jgi:hypothetical protein
LPYLAVGRVEDDVPGVGVDAGDPGDLAFDPGFLERLADRCLCDRFAEVYRAAGDSPVAVVRAPDHQDVADGIGHDNVDGRNEAVRSRCLRVVVEVNPPVHAFLCLRGVLSPLGSRRETAGSQALLTVTVSSLGGPTTSSSFSSARADR